MEYLRSQVQRFLSQKPDLERALYISPSATILGAVTLEKGCNVYPGAVLRADIQTIHVQENSNLQDNCVLHVSADCPVKIGRHVTIAHGAIIHGCRIGDFTMIGMNSTILDGAVIGKNCLIGANVLITQRQIIPDNSFVLGVPGKVLREITPEEKIWLRTLSETYLLLGEEFKNNH